MNRKTASLSIIISLLVSVLSMAGLKEAKDSPVIRVDRPNGKGEFQLLVHVRIPDLPENAHIDHAFLILDQEFEMPVIADTSRLRSARDTMEVPRGLRNKGHEPLMLSVHGLEGGAGGANWMDQEALDQARLHTSPLYPVSTIQAERKENRWSTEAIKFIVTPFVREKAKKKNPNVKFIITGTRQNDEVLTPPNVEVDVSNLRGRLTIYYTEPPVLPPGIK